MSVEYISSLMQKDSIQVCARNAAFLLLAVKWDLILSFVMLFRWELSSLGSGKYLGGDRHYSSLSNNTKYCPLVPTFFPRN